MELKKCTVCKETKPLAEFHKDRSRYDELSSSCKICCSAKGKTRYRKDPTFHQARTKVWKMANAERQKKWRTDYGRRKNFGVTPEDVERMRATQSDTCAICQAPFGVPYVDHDHQTGRVRGLLCRNCNIALGMAKDLPETFDRIAEYLRQYEAVPILQH